MLTLETSRAQFGVQLSVIGGEQQVGYIVRQIKRMDREKLAWIDIRSDVMAAFNERMQKDVKEIDVWQIAYGGDYYYRSPIGRFVTNFPGTMDDFAAQIRRMEPDAFEFAKAD